MILTIIFLLIVLIFLLSCSIMVNVLTKVKKEKRDTRPFIYAMSFFFVYFYYFINKNLGLYRGNKFLIIGTIF